MKTELEWDMWTKIYEMVGDDEVYMTTRHQSEVTEWIENFGRPHTNYVFKNIVSTYEYKEKDSASL